MLKDKDLQVVQEEGYSRLNTFQYILTDSIISTALLSACVVSVIFILTVPLEQMFRGSFTSLVEFESRNTLWSLWSTAG